MEQLKETLKTILKLNCVGIKISFEDEGALYNEVISMRHLTTMVGLDLYLKIGGCEAKRDIIDSIDIGVDAIVAPMVESEFALNKFITSIDQYQYKYAKGFNLETIEAYNNLDKIKNQFNKIDFITVGRVDFVSSLKKDRLFVDSDYMYDVIYNIFTEAKKQNIMCCLGGAVSINSKKLIQNLFNNNLIDKFETRYIIFKTENIDFDKFDEMLYYANKFEVEWMKFISSKYNGHANKDTKRIEMIEQRLSANNNFQ